jgi:class 3 adenylate cyclase
VIGGAQLLMRISIAFKIFGIALTLLVLLAIAAAYSTANVRKVADEVEAIGRYFTPLSRTASRVQVRQLQQALVFERLLQRYALVARTDSSVADAQAEFAELGQQIDGDLAAALQLIAEGFAAARTEQDRMEFVELRPAFQTVAKEHQDYEDLATRTMTALEGGERPSYDLLRDMVAREEAELLRELDALRGTLQAYTQSSIQEAADHETRILRLNILITAIAAVSGLLFASLVTTGMMRPIRRLVAGTQAIEQGDLETLVPVTSRDEIGLLTQSFNHMVSELRVKEHIKATFGKYVDPRIVEDLLQRPDAVAVAGDRREVTVFFSDIEGFTAIGESLTPGGLVAVINQYFTVMSEPIVRNGGIIDKFIGDGIMAFWAPPFVPAEEHATRACLAALEQLEILGEFQQRLPDLIGVRTAVPRIRIRVGLASGDVVIGNIGSEKFKGYTVMGDTVNLSSRLESAGKQYGVRILISEQTYRLASASIEVREVDSIRVTGKTEPARVYELLGRRGALDQGRASLRDLYQQGLEHYRGGQWAAAEQTFQQCLALDPGDVPSRLFAERAAHFRSDPPASTWDGVWTLTQK